MTRFSILRYSGLSKGRIKLLFLCFFLAFSVPTLVLIWQAYKQLKWEAFHQHQLLAEELAGRIDKNFTALIVAEEARSFSDYVFFNIAGNNTANFLQRSPLSMFPLAGDTPGLIGYFQIDTYGHFSTPLLPVGVNTEQYGISEKEREQRLSAQNRIQTILSDNQLVRQTVPADPQSAGAVIVDNNLQQIPSDADALGSESGIAERTASAATQKKIGIEKDDAYYPAQAAFDKLNTASETYSKDKLGRIENPKKESASRSQSALAESLEAQNKLSKRVLRKEQEVLPELEQALAPSVVRDEQAQQGGIKVSIFESEIDSFEFSMLDTGHFVLYRKVWRDGQRYIQGILFEKQALLQGLIEAEFQHTALARMSNLILGYQRDVLAAYGGDTGRDYFSRTAELNGVLLYQMHLTAPFNQLDLIFNITHLPPGPGSVVVTWASLILIGVLCIGLYFLYRLALRQSELMQQQQNFVSAVSHELKTPLTSIRMYGEILKAGWADESKKQQYYAFIYDESERLSRLIENTLQLAQMTHSKLKLDLRSLTIGEAMDNVRAKIDAHIERAGYVATFVCENDIRNCRLTLDTDVFIQIIINLVDNAMKFSRDAQNKTIIISALLFNRSEVVFSVRDYGPGIAKDQIKKIFTLFYRSENELTRKTTGTGIGLALVHQLTLAMNGKVDVINAYPGAEFRLMFPLVVSKNTI